MHILGGAALVLSFALLYQRRIRACLAIYALQSCTVAVAAGLQATAHAAPALFATAALTLLANGLVIPVILARIVRRLGLDRSAALALGVFPSMLMGLAFTALAILALRPVHASSQDLAIALAVLLLGLLVMISRRHALLQVIGFLSIENGLVLAATDAHGMPLLLELALAILVMLAVTVFGVFFFRSRERFDSLDVAELERIGRLRG